MEPKTIVVDYRGFEIRATSFRTGPVAFSPAYEILHGNESVYAQCAQSASEHPTAQHACLAALESARRWIGDHPITVCYLRRRFIGADDTIDAGPFRSIEEARSAPFPVGFDEAVFSIGQQTHACRRHHGWEVVEGPLATSARRTGFFSTHSSQGV